MRHLAPILRPALAPLGFLLVCGGWTIWRAGHGESLWEDEIYSLVLASQTVEQIFEHTSADLHPPGYYLALKAWLKVPRLAGVEPGLLWARGLNVLVWIGLGAVCWLWSRRPADRATGPLLACAVAGSAAATTWAIDLRGYCMVFAAAVLGLLVVTRDLFVEAPRPRDRLLPWAVYAAAAALALWVHLLAVPLVGLLFVAWAIGAAVRRRGRYAALLPGLAAHALAALAIVPWALTAVRQVGSLKAAAPGWMTPASAANLVHVVAYWFPLGRLGTPEEPPIRGLAALGIASFAVPALVLLVRLVRRRGVEPRRAPTAFLALVGLSVGLLFTLLLWAGARWADLPVFHGPRYPLLAAGLWGAGLAGAAALTSAAPWARWLALAPWLLCGVVSQALLGFDEPRRGLARDPSALGRLAGDRAVFAFPSELIPFVADGLAPLSVRRIEDFPCEAGREAATIVDLSPWPDVDRLRDRLVRRALSSGRLAAERERLELPADRPVIVAHRLADLDAGALAALCRSGWSPSGRSIPPDAVAVGLPEDQRRRDGWSYLEVGEDLSVGRWGARRELVVDLDGDVEPGRYALRLAGERLPHPAPVAGVRVRVEGEGRPVAFDVPPGPFELSVPLVVRRRHRDLRVVVTHPEWSPSAELGTSDSRTLTLFFRAAWLTRAL